MSEEQGVNVKQRIIGALVLVSLGIILIPMLLNGGRESSSEISGTNIPEMPEALKKVLPDVPEAKIMPKPQQVKIYPEGELGDNESNKTQEKLQDSSKSKAISNNYFEKAKKPASKKINLAYTLQIASFSRKKNAYDLRDKLRKKAYKAYVESVATSKGRIYRLRVGPYLKFTQISADKKKIEKAFNITKSIIVKYKT